MTSLTEPVPANGEKNGTLINDVNEKRHSHKCRHSLKSKENTLRHKCNKVLKRRLKQYKLRLDGKEDQDILDVSDILVNSLTLKSPGSKDNHLENSNLVSDKPKNYLFRMVRNKQNQILNGNCNDATIGGENNSLCDSSSQDKKQTNAFKLLMDSRSKSIGSNSPGKEKNVEEVINEEILERKNAKAKRILVLQKMSEAKGSLKKQEMEECQDKYIDVQMKKRAEKFKNMLLNQEPKSHEIKKRISKKYKKKTLSKVNYSSDIIKTKSEEEPKQIKTLQLVNLFSDQQIDFSEETVKTKKVLTKEDKDFLEKLSPSMKKKENMLCYFMKVEKEAEPLEDDIVIKVKLPSKTNRNVKNKKKHNALFKPCTETSLQNQTNKSPVEQRAPIERQKRKRNCGDHNQDVKTGTVDVLGDTSNRPKRCTKKPVKYNDDIILSSSDEELHIFTPKKKKHIHNRTVTPVMNTKTESSTNCIKNDQKTEKTPLQLKKDVKLAPIFKIKQRPDAILSEAKQKFLQSGVPEQLKKIIAQQKNNNIGEVSFHTVVHVQQNKDLAKNRLNINIPFICTDSIIEDNNEIYDTNFFYKMLHLQCYKPPGNKWGMSMHTDINKTLQEMKLVRPRFPVYRTYRLLRDKRKGEYHCPNYLDLDNSVEITNSTIDLTNENPDQLNWTDKYKAMSTNQIIGNFETVKELRKWLVTWTETAQRSKNKVSANSDSSDFYTDTDSRDSGRSVNNLIIITGPTGSGKTSSVYAVAADLAIKVIEVNASTKRTGKVMLQDLQEATQSHKVNRGANHLDMISKSQEIKQIEITKKSNKQGRPKKTVKMTTKKTKERKHDPANAPSGSQDMTRTDTSLILIDDADIMFDQDDGFCSAVTQLVHSSKRPVILVTSSLSCPHLQKFLQSGKILKMNPLMPQMLGTWLDIMCLADSGTCSPGAGARFLNHFNGDVRKTINCLQFYVTSHPQTSVNDDNSPQIFDNPKLLIDDEKSNMSWVDQEDNEEKNIIRSNIFENETDYLWNNYVQSQFKLISLKSPLDALNTWWNLPQTLNLQEDKSDNKRLASIANVMDCISISDYYSNTTSNDRLNITSGPWYTSESHSVSEQENLHYYKRSQEVCDEISYELINISIANAQRNFMKSKDIAMDFPGMTMQRERDRIVSRHKNMTSYLNPAAIMDRRALALDYWAYCRSICRIEKKKSDNYSKRNNRFCHYLKSVNILCKNESFDYLCDSLALVITKK